MVDMCSIIKYPQEWGFRREPARPIDLRIDYCNGMKFDENFDWDNLWYDAVQINDTTILLIGPPLYSTKEWLTSNVKFEDENKNNLQFKSFELDRVCYTALTVNGYNNYITLITPVSNTHINVNRNNGNLNNKTVMVTLQKNNPISWIKQWISYHQKIYNINAFLIYDNASTIYNITELESKLFGLGAIITVVSWPFPYGPQGSDFAPWDSDFGQYVMLEHAKIRYLSQAKLVINQDIDELLVTNNINLDNIVNYLRNNDIKCLRYKGIWIESYDIVNNKSAEEIPLEERHFKNYYCVDPHNKIGIGYKWMLVPTSNTLNQQWLVHHITGQTIESDQISYRHSRSHNTGWSWKRDKFLGNVNDLVIDRLFLKHLNKME